MRSTTALFLLTLAIPLAACDSGETPENTDGAVAVDSLPAFEAPADTSSLAGLPGLADSLPLEDESLPAPAGSGSSAAQPLRPGSSPGTSSPAPVSEPAAAPANSGAAASLLDRTEQRYASLRSMSADFVQNVYVPLLESEVDSQGTLYHKSPDRFAMRFSQPSGDVVVSDGRYLWMYYPSTDPRQVMRTALAGEGQRVDLYREFLSDANDRFSITGNVAETVGGRSTRALTLVPRGPSPYRQVRLWIDTQDTLVRRFEITEENGTVRDIRLSNLRPNAELADNLFRFDPPANTQVHDF